MDVGWCSQAGKRYGDLNQDYAILQEMFSAEEIEGNPHASQCLIAGVADGHGMLGEEAAKGGGKAIVRYLMRSELQRKALCDMSDAGIRELLVEAFEKGHRSALNAIANPPQTLQYPGNNCRKTQEWTLVQADGVDMYQGAKGQERLLENGASCSVALIQGNKLVIADVGDSLVVLGRESASGEASAELVSQRHSIRDPEEVERLLKHHSDSIEVLEDDGYVRVTQGQLFGYELAMTRALGHRHMVQHGVSHEPHVASITLEPEHCCLMVGSDGVWDHVDRDAAVQFCVREMSRDRTAQQIATDIVAQALAIADKQGEDDAADNATLVLERGPLPSGCLEAMSAELSASRLELSSLSPADAGEFRYSFDRNTMMFKVAKTAQRLWAERKADVGLARTVGGRRSALAWVGGNELERPGAWTADEASRFADRGRMGVHGQA